MTIFRIDTAFDKEHDEYLYRPLCLRKGFDDFAVDDQLRPYLKAGDRDGYRQHWIPMPCFPCRGGTGGEKSIVLGDVVSTLFGCGAAFSDKAVALLTPYVKWCCEFHPLDVTGTNRHYFILTEFCESEHLVDHDRTVVNEFRNRFSLVFVCAEQDVPSFFMLGISMFVKDDLWNEIVASGITGLQATEVEAIFPDSPGAAAGPSPAAG